jgi:Protein of unknown function (DUF3108)
MSTLFMPSPALPYPAGARSDAMPPWRTLVALTLAVLMAHWALLGGLPSLLPSWQSDGRLAGSSQSTEAFVTRTMPAPVAEPPPAPKASVEHVSELPTSLAEPAPSFQDIAPIAPVPPAVSVSATPLAPLVPLAPLAPPTPSGDDGDSAYGVAGLADDGAPLVLVFPNPARLLYDVKGEVKGIPYSANAELVWKHDGKTYDARLQISHWIASRTQTSKGALTAQGLEPLRFGDKVRSEVAAHFEREKGKVSFSANTPDAPLTAGAQDQLSVFMQLAALFGGNSNRLTQGVIMSFQAIGSRSSENWVFKVDATETLKLPGGEVPTVKLVRDSLGENDAKGEIWLAPSLGYLPVRIRLTQGSSDFVDQLWRSTQIH